MATMATSLLVLLLPGMSLGCDTIFTPGNSNDQEQYFSLFSDNGYPDQYSSDCEEVFVHLEVMVAEYVGPSVRQRTRVYNGGLLAPTIRVKPGQRLLVNLTNSLPPQSEYNVGTRNNFHVPSVTNLHTHGLHISSKPPGDSIFIEVWPGKSHLYVYDIPADHMGGTFWYHAHNISADADLARICTGV